MNEKNNYAICLEMDLEDFNVLHQNVIRLVDAIIKEEDGREYSILDSAFFGLTVQDGNDRDSLLASAMTYVLKRREHPYRSMVKKLGKTGKKHFIRGVKKGEKGKRFEVRYSKSVFGKENLEALRNFYPTANSDSEAAKMAFTEIELLSYKSKLSLFISSPGGKTNALDMFDLDVLGCTTLVEPFGRTIAFSLRYCLSFDNVVCGEIDYRFINYFNIVRDHPMEMIRSIKRQFKKFAAIRDIGKQKAKHKKLTNFSKKVESNSSEAIKIAAAAALYILLNASLNGSGDNISKTQMADLIKRLDGRVSSLKYTSLFLPSIKYLLNDFRKTIRKYRNDKSVAMIVDPPYLKALSVACKCYGCKDFDYKDMLDLFRLLEKAKCKVILFHIQDDWFNDRAISYGFHKVGYYEGRNIGSKVHNTYITEVYSLNIDPSVKFFDPKKRGKLYTNDSSNTQPDSGISSDKGV